ncbi:MAG: aspartate--tRNA(Asn) ligase, partial [Candidatus Aenigmatarchaeota archaeon]
HFTEQGFVETHTPVIQAAGAEGGATMFPVIYYNKEAFLRQSPQLYKQMLMASGFDKVYEIGPAFRAEESHTRKHVSEFQSIDMEMAWIDSEEDVMKVLEEMIHYIYRGLKKEHSELLGSLDLKLKVPEIPFKRLAYDEVIKLISKKAKVKWGDDMGDLEERILGEILAKKGIEWYFITKFPSEIKPFYIMMDGKHSRGFDLGCKGMEIASGGQREHRIDVLKRVMKSKGLDPEKFTFYLDPFRYGCPSMGGWAVGGDRLVEQIASVPDIKEVIMFPRTPERMVP